MTIEIYTRPGCGYCNHAKKLLENREVSYVEYDVYQNPEHFDELQQRTTSKTFPQIFVAGQSIGGFTELLALDKSGTLAAAAN
ncbi:glutaredoxin domain-containing protein [Thalassotalea ganghwensis]